MALRAETPLKIDPLGLKFGLSGQNFGAFGPQKLSWMASPVDPPRRRVAQGLAGLKNELAAVAPPPRGVEKTLER